MFAHALATGMLFASYPAANAAYSAGGLAIQSSPNNGVTWNPVVYIAPSFTGGLSDKPWLEIDNNSSERTLRPCAIGRKNWMFFGSDRGGETAAILMSILASALPESKGLVIARPIVPDVHAAAAGYVEIVVVGT